MATVTLRKWGGAVAISLPKKILAMLSLEASAEVKIAAENGKIVLSPVRKTLSLSQLIKEQKQLERQIGRRPTDRQWLDDAARGEELL